ncbi:MAG: glycerol-3-phosphate acyltransferase [Desulfatitalea sp.]|nr:glycerol-3-phosphate acyltransferase [Desulfatitalea sp.]NNJ99916.1 glycerol-3-phosphate acyltransferase [Desulfatitalea sp.]
MECIGVTALAIVAAYLAGSINFSILLSHLLGKPDPRTRFSGNPGATNVYRQAGRLAAGTVLVLDMIRAAAVAQIIGWYWVDAWLPWAGLALILGNRFPCFHGFRGGKGVANFLGFYALYLPWATMCALIAYLAMLAWRRTPFLASFAMIAVLTVFGAHRWADSAAGLTGLLLTTGLIVCFHRSNISRMLHRQ